MSLFLAMNQFFSVIRVPINYVVLAFYQICLQPLSGILINDTVHSIYVISHQLATVIHYGYSCMPVRLFNP